MSLRKIAGVIGVVVLIVAAVLVGQYYGRRGPRPVEWLSQAIGRYFVDQEVRCASPDGGKTPGKSLGWIKADLNLTNGKIRIVRNDPGKWPVCGD